MTPKSILPWKYKGATTAEGKIWIKNLCTKCSYHVRLAELQWLYRYQLKLSCIRSQSADATLPSDQSVVLTCRMT